MRYGFFFFVALLLLVPGVQAQKASVETVQFQSKLVSASLPYHVILPPDYRASSATRYPVLYLLHGFGGHYSDWVTRTNVADYAAQYRMILVMPEGNNGWYTDSAGMASDKYESYILKELIPDVQKRYRTIEARYGRAIAGLSMGGYGALKFGLKSPDTFVFVGSLSGALHIAAATEDDLKNLKAIRDSVFGVFGPVASDVRKANDIYEITRGLSVARVGGLPYIYLDCGTEDFLVTATSNSRRCCARRRFPTNIASCPASITGLTGISRCRKFCSSPRRRCVCRARYRASRSAVRRKELNRRGRRGTRREPQRNPCPETRKNSRLLNFAIQTARDAGHLLAERFGGALSISNKSELDLVTEADLASERLIIERIKTNYPHHAILAEESGASAPADQEAQWRWIVDPLDGTTNYAHGYPCFCVSMGLEHEGKLELGVIYDPVRDELFTAERGQGATLNGRRIQVSQTNNLNSALLCTGFPYDVRERSEFARHFTNFIMKAQAVRRDGSAALDLAYVACGRFDGFWEEGLHPWDVAGGVLMIEEAGGRVSHYDGAAFDIYGAPILASNGLVHEQMMRVLAV